MLAGFFGEVREMPEIVSRDRRIAWFEAMAVQECCTPTICGNPHDKTLHCQSCKAAEALRRIEELVVDEYEFVSRDNGKA